MTGKSLLSHKFLILKRLGSHDTPERVNEDVRIVSVVVTPFEFLYVLVHVFGTHLVECPDNGTLKEAPHAFYAVSVDIPDNPFLFGMINCFVACIVVGNADIGFKLVRVDGFRLVLYSSSDKAMDGFLFDVRDFLNSDFPASLDSSRNPGLISLVSTALILCLTSHKRFVHFNHSDKSGTFKGFVSHGLTDPVAEIPSGLVRNSKGTLHLVSRDPFLGFTHKIDSDKPLAERKVGVMHNGSTHNGKLVSATSALPAVLFLKLKHFYATAAGTVYTHRPADLLKCLTALIIGLKFIHQGYKV